MPNQAMKVSGKLDPTQAGLKSDPSPEAAGPDRQNLNDACGCLRSAKRAVMSNDIFQFRCNTTTRRPPKLLDRA